MYHFFVTPAQIADGYAVITGQDVNHIRNVLRMKAGEQVGIRDGISRSYISRIEKKALEKLQAALEELGCTVDELNLSIDCADDSLRRNCATFLQEQWRQNLGIENITVNSMQTKQVSANRQSGDYCMSLGGWSPDYNDAINFLDLWVTDGGNNDSFWSNEEYDNLIAQATAEADEEVRQQYLFDAEEILAAEMPIIPLYWQCQNYSYNKDKIVDGAIITANQTTFYYATLAE